MYLKERDCIINFKGTLRLSSSLVSLCVFIFNVDAGFKLDIMAYST